MTGKESLFPFRYLSVIWPGNCENHETLEAAMTRIKNPPVRAIASNGSASLVPSRCIVVDRKTGNIVDEVGNRV